MPLPVVATPPVDNRVVIHQSADNTLPAVDDEAVSPPPSPIASSSPQRRVIHASPDHLRLLSSQITQPIIAEIQPSLSFTLDDVFSARVAFLRHIPKTAQREMASLKNRVWSDFLRNPDDEIYF